jgi:arylsulfatase A-like enzyme
VTATAFGAAPNVVVVVTDNQSADSLGCYGNTEHETPRLDRLAREGVRFDRAFCTNGLCSPARASILTGLMPSQHGVHMAMADDDVLAKPDDYDVTREFRSMAQTLRDHGYTTAMVGKWHLGNHRCPGNGFEHWVALTKGHTTDFWDNTVFHGGTAPRAGTTERVRGQHIVEYFTDRAVEFLDHRDPGRPFFLMVNYDGPYVLPPTVVGADARNPFHERFAGRPYQPFPPVDDRLIASLAVPFDFDLDPAEEYTMAAAFNNVWWCVRVHNDAATRATIAAENALVDREVGRVVDALDERGLGPETLVVVTTDQGNPYGQRGLWGHPVWTDPPYMHDVTFRVPLIVRRPRVVAAQRVVDRIVSHVDLLATVLDHVGLGHLEMPGSPGRSLEPFLRGTTPEGWVDEAFFENETARSVRTLEYLYTTHLDGTGEAELYDLIEDPQQWHNVAGDPARAGVVARLDGRLREFFAAHADPRYDLWQGGRCQGLVSRYLTFKQRWGPDWDMTMEVGPAFRDR